MSYHHDHSYSSKDSRRIHGSDVKLEDRLPSIRHMVGDVFDGKASPYDFNDVKRSLPQISHDSYPRHAQHDYQRGPTLPPIYAGHAPSHSAHSYTSQHHNDNSYRKSSHGDHSTIPRTSNMRVDYPSDSHGIYQALYTSKNGDLVTVSTSSSPHGILRTWELPDEGDSDPKKKYKCPECGKRFDRPSGLDQHMPRHTKERAFSCPVSGCDWTFTVRSNMTRHVRTQHHMDPNIVDHHDDTSHHSVYSSTSRTSSDKYSPQSGNYYSSSRRQ